MTKEIFTEAIHAIRNQLKLDDEISLYLSNAFPNAFRGNLMPDNSLIVNMLIKVLATEIGDKSDWIEYYCYETDFGEKDLAVTDGGVNVPLKTASDLYNLILGI